ncbi:MAG: hypothetical protein WCD31_10275 [Gillisia sp.]
MLKKFLFTVFFISASCVFAQESIQLKGKIVADSLQGFSINIVNLSNFVGTNNAPDGSFEIKASVNDTLFFSSVQFKKKKVVVSPEIFRKGFLEVHLEENINELAEVNISNVDLTGNLSADLEKIKVYDLPVNFNGANVRDLKFASDWHDPLERPHNMALYGKKQLPGANILGILGLISKIIPHKEHFTEPAIVNIPKGEMTTELRKMFDEQFFTRDLHIKPSSINDFIYFCVENGMDSKMLAFKNRLELIDFLKSHSKSYLTLMSDIEED